MLTQSILKNDSNIKILNENFEQGKHKTLTVDSFHQLGELGKGAFGQVKKIKSKMTGKMYALKIMEKRNIVLEDMVGQFKKESKFWCNQQSRYSCSQTTPTSLSYTPT
jgi:serine/threonine protein kinase